MADAGNRNGDCVRNLARERERVRGRNQPILASGEHERGCGDGGKVDLKLLTEDRAAAMPLFGGARVAFEDAERFRMLALQEIDELFAHLAA